MTRTHGAAGHGQAAVVDHTLQYQESKGLRKAQQAHVPQAHPGVPGTHWESPRETLDVMVFLKTFLWVSQGPGTENSSGICCQSAKSHSRGISLQTDAPAPLR